MATTATILTVEEFLTLPESEGVKRELINGELVEMSSGGPRHEMVKTIFLRKFAHYFEANNLPGNVFSETRYLLGPHQAPQPDISIVLSGRLDPQGTGKTTIVPDIVVEVVSSESAESLQERIQMFLDHGVKAVLFAYPLLRLIDVYRQSGVKRLVSSDRLEDAECLPGFSVPVSDFFKGVAT